MRFEESDSASHGQHDFVPRERKNQIRTTILIFTSAMALIFMSGYASGESFQAYTPLIAVGIVGVLCFAVVFGKQQNIDQLMSTEYQNLLFAQAVALGSSFCMIVRRDGTIVYANDGLREVFPNFVYADSRALDGLLERSGVPKTDRERILGAILGQTQDRLIFPIQNEKGIPKDYILTVEPLIRPGGYSLVRGREYLGQRTGTQLMPDVLRATSAEKLDHMLTNTPVAHYTTNAYGDYEYVNPAMEQLLGYGPGELMGAKQNIARALVEMGGKPVPQDYTIAAYGGDVTLTRKNGKTTSGMLFQTLIRDVNGKIEGASGSILPIEARR